MSRDKRKRKVKPRIFFFVEGETEKAFFEALSQHYRLTAAKVVRIMNNSGQDWVEKAKNMMLHDVRVKPDAETRVFIIFDKNNNSESEILGMVHKAKLLTINKSTTTIGFSNNAFEVWLLAHYERVSSGLKSQTVLNQRLSDYLGEPYVKADREQMEKILKNDKVFCAIENSADIATLSVQTQSTNIGQIVDSVLVGN